MKITKENYKEVVPEKEQTLILALLQDLDEYYFPRVVEIHYQDWHDDNGEYPDYYGTYSIRWSDNSNENINSEMTIHELDMNMCTLCQAFEQLYEMEKNENPEKEDKKKITKDELDMYLTCRCCPEQYDVYLGDKNIGYIRLRHGRLTCEYLLNGKLDDSTVLVLLKDFEDGYKGVFDTDDERSEYLDRCKQCLVDYYNSLYR